MGGPGAAVGGLAPSAPPPRPGGRKVDETEIRKRGLKHSYHHILKRFGKSIYESLICIQNKAKKKILYVSGIFPKKIG